MKIDKFDGGYRFLSNFYMHPVKLDGVIYPSSEHGYQAAKTLDPAQREIIRTCSTPGQAKRAGKKVSLRPDWESVKLQVMEDLVRQKFNSPGLKELLLSTNNDELVEGNAWGDTYWGVCNGRGQNHLGKILMKVRQELRGSAS
jgi:N-glycosidase YbiA